MKILLFAIIIHLPIVFYGQDKTLTINVDGIRNRHRTMKIDSVFFDNQKLFKNETNDSIYIIPKIIINKDFVKLPIYLYAGSKVYSFEIEKVFLTSCVLYHRISFIYSHRKECYILTNCKSKQTIGVLKAKKII